MSRLGYFKMYIIKLEKFRTQNIFFPQFSECKHNIDMFGLNSPFFFYISKGYSHYPSFIDTVILFDTFCYLFA